MGWAPDGCEHFRVRFLPQGTEGTSDKGSEEMKKLRLLFAIFAVTMISGCIDVAPTAPQDCLEDCEDGIFGSGN